MGFGEMGHNRGQHRTDTFASMRGVKSAIQLYFHITLNTCMSFVKKLGKRRIIM